MHRLALLISACLFFVGHWADGAELPPDDEYVVADANGHLRLKGERQRYWGVIGGFLHTPELKPEDTAEERQRKIDEAYADVDALVQRFADLGFNLNRMWHGDAAAEYTKSDGSKADIVDYYILRIKQRGLRLWCAGVNRFGKITPDDVGIIYDPATADEWQAAVREWNEGQVDLWNIVRKWDPRFEALAIRRCAEAVTHRNQHTGLRWCDDPVFVAWELSNEEWRISKMVGGQWRSLPEYWQRTLIAR